MAVKYRVHYRESERGWGSDEWHVDFDTHANAQKSYDNTNSVHFNGGLTPDYYLIATGIETVTIPDPVPVVEPFEVGYE